MKTLRIARLSFELEALDKISLPAYKGSTLRGGFGHAKETVCVSLDPVRSILKNLGSSGKVKCLGRGQSAEWQKSDKWK